MPHYELVTPAPVSPLASQERVRMRDGVHLAADVYLPTVDGVRDTSAGDTILIRLPYDKSGTYTFIDAIAAYFMRSGYRVVAQDVRGKFRSEGAALLFVNESEDGFDTLEWITQQAWSNGRVAMWGDSYYGYTQWAAAASEHPALKAIAPRVTGTGLGEPASTSAEGRVQPVEMGITYLYPLTHFAQANTYLWEPDWSKRNFAEQAEDFLAFAGKRSISYDQWTPHPVSLQRFPKGDPFAGRSVPALQTIGWWDNCAPHSWNDVKAIAQRPQWDALHYLRIESIDHENHSLLEAQEDRVEVRSESQLEAMLPDYLDPALEFFEVFVRGNGRVQDVPRVTWNLAGTQEFRTSDRWPPQHVRFERRFATAVGQLENTAPQAGSELSWVHNSADPAPSSADDAFSYLRILPDEAPLGQRADVLVFTGAEQTADVELAGPMTATAWFSSTGPVADLFVRVLDLHPDGTALRIARGQIQLKDAQKGAHLEIDLGHVGYLLKAGHRLRIHVSSSDYPEFLPQPGTGADPWAHGEATVPNTQTIHLGGTDGLSISVPILKGELA